MTRPETDAHVFSATRIALHALAEHLLASDLSRRTGKIALRATPGGFGQPETFSDGVRHRIRIDGTSIAVTRGDIEEWAPVTTAAAAAQFAGTALGAPSDGPTETALDPDARLAIDPAAAARIADFYAVVDQALAEIRRRYADRKPTIAQLWPEHFDLACTIAEVNLGGSPGDHDHDEPYFYVGPWAPVSGEPWNETWGLSRPASDISSVADAVDFFEHGFRLALTVS